MVDRLRATLAIVFLIGSSSVAAAAPPQLLNKTIYITYTASVPINNPSGGTRVGVRHVKRWLYISSLGRIFSRAARAEGRAGETTDKGPGEATFRFQGNSLVGVLTFLSGASQMTITFDPGFQSCTVALVTGREGGQAVKFRALDGSVKETAGPMTFSDLSCSIKDGNVFAGQ